MTITDLLPSRRRDAAVCRGESGPFDLLRRPINEVFDDFFRGSGLRASEDCLVHFSPKIDIAQTETQFSVTAELPGMDEKDIDVTLTHDYLTINPDCAVQMGVPVKW